MLNYNFSEDLLAALKYALRGSGVIPQYVFNVIEPIIEKHAAQQSVQADGADICPHCGRLNKLHCGCNEVAE